MKFLLLEMAEVKFSKRDKDLKLTDGAKSLLNQYILKNYFDIFLYFFE